MSVGNGTSESTEGDWYDFARRLYRRVDDMDHEQRAVRSEVRDLSASNRALAGDVRDLMVRVDAQLRATGAQTQATQNAIAALDARGWKANDVRAVKWAAVAIALAMLVMAALSWSARGG
jgi:hypothetical protein